MTREQFDTCVAAFDNGPHGDAYKVLIHTVSGNCYGGALYRRVGDLVTLDQGDEKKSNVIVSLPMIEAIELDL